MKMRTITSFGDQTSGTSFIIPSVSPTKITRSHGPITLWIWMFSTVLHLLVYSLTVGFCTISQQFQSIASKLSLFTNDPFFQVEWFIATLILCISHCSESDSVSSRVFYSAVSTAWRFLLYVNSIEKWTGMKNTGLKMQEADQIYV